MNTHTLAAIAAVALIVGVIVGLSVGLAEVAGDWTAVVQFWTIMIALIGGACLLSFLILYGFAWNQS